MSNEQKHQKTRATLGKGRDIANTIEKKYTGLRKGNGGRRRIGGR